MPKSPDLLAELAVVCLGPQLHPDIASVSRADPWPHYEELQPTLCRARPAPWLCAKLRGVVIHGVDGGAVPPQAQSTVAVIVGIFGARSCDVARRVCHHEISERDVSSHDLLVTGEWLS
jgi:hypothetical protein